MRSLILKNPSPITRRSLPTLALEQVSPYRWRLKDQECTITADVQQSADGYEVWLNVQAEDAHEHRVAEIAQAFDAYLVSSLATPEPSPGPTAPTSVVPN